MAGGATGAFAGRKAGGHGILGAVGGAIIGSLAEDYAKKGKKAKHGKQKSSRAGSMSSDVSNSSAASGFGSVASSFFNSKH